jgi:hypothetical protein
LLAILAYRACRDSHVFANRRRSLDKEHRLPNEVTLFTLLGPPPPAKHSRLVPLQPVIEDLLLQTRSVLLGGRRP